MKHKKEKKKQVYVYIWTEYVHVNYVFAIDKKYWRIRRNDVKWNYPVENRITKNNSDCRHAIFFFSFHLIKQIVWAALPN